MGFQNIRSLRDVADIVANLDAVPGEVLPRGFQVFRAPRQHRDLGARLGKSPHHRKSDPLAAAGDDGHAVLHCDVHFLPPWVRQLCDRSVLYRLTLGERSSPQAYRARHLALTNP